MDGELVVMCAWCGETVERGSGAWVSHGICLGCATALLARLPEYYAEVIAAEDGSVSLFSGQTIGRTGPRPPPS